MADGNAPERARLELPAGLQDRLAVFDAEDVVRLRAERGAFGAERFFNGARARGGKGQARREVGAQVVRKLRGKQVFGDAHKRRGFAAFAAEKERVRAERVQQRYAAEGKALRAGQRPRQRKLQHEVRAVLQREPRARPLIERRRLAALYEISAHCADDGAARRGPHVAQQRRMTVVQRVEFTNYAGNPVFYDHFA